MEHLCACMQKRTNLRAEIIDEMNRLGAAMPRDTKPSDPDFIVWLAEWDRLAAIKAELDEQLRIVPVRV